MESVSELKRSRNSCRRGNKNRESYSEKRKRYLKKNMIRIGLLLTAVIIAYLAGRKAGETKAYEDMEIQLLDKDTTAISGQISNAGKNPSSGSSPVVTYGAEGNAGGVDKEAEDKEAKDTDAEDTDAAYRELTVTQKRKILEELWEEHPELILVNKDYKLSEDYEVELKKLPDGNIGAVDAYDALCDMLKAGRKEGLSFEICSSYRSVERQQELLEEDIDELLAKGYSYKEAYEEATQDTMPPGYSEHATGYAFDIVALSYQMLDQKQQNTPECIWLAKHCAEYGFILRYPEDKEEITGIVYEAWHFRYVGKEAAAYIMEEQITLEEYLEEYVKEYLEEVGIS